MIRKNVFNFHFHAKLQQCVCTNLNIYSAVCLATKGFRVNPGSRRTRSQIGIELSLKIDWPLWETSESKHPLALALSDVPTDLVLLDDDCIPI